MRPPVDSIPDQAILIHVEEWFQTHPITEGKTIQSEKIFLSPRSSMSLAILKDPIPVIGRHMHATTDEIIFVYKGTGEMYINGQWVPVKAGDVHVCPRGVIHATRASAGGEMWMIGMFTPPQPKDGHDRIMIDG